MKKIVIEWLREKTEKEEYEFSGHADLEREADKIFIFEIEEAILKGEILENYPEDLRGSSYLSVRIGQKRKMIFIPQGMVEKVRERTKRYQEINQQLIKISESCVASIGKE